MTTTDSAPRPRLQFYFIDEVSRETRRSPAAVRFLIASGKLGSIKQGGRRVVTYEQLEKFLAGEAA